MVKGIDIRLRRLEDLCDEHFKAVYSNLCARITLLLTPNQEDAFWSAIDKAQAGRLEGLTPEELQAQLTPEEDEAHWIFCLDPEAWELFCVWMRGYSAQKGTELPELPTPEEIKLLYEQRSFDGNEG
jgi:hypothetical protein